MLDTLATYRERIRYLHLKDVDAAGHWAMLGSGICDTPAVIAAVQRAPNFNGWLVLEEESDEAARDPAAAVRANRATMRRLLALNRGPPRHRRCQERLSERSRSAPAARINETSGARKGQQQLASPKVALLSPESALSIGSRTDTACRVAPEFVERAMAA